MAWTYEQKFNTLNNGDLNGQDSWSGDVSYDVVDTLAFEGAKSVRNNTGISVSILRVLPAGVTVGITYVALRWDVNTDTNTCQGGIRYQDDAANQLTNFDFRRVDANNVNLIYGDSISGINVLTAATINTWYVAALEFNTNGDGKFRVKWWSEATGWSAWTGWKIKKSDSFDGTIYAVRFYNEGTTTPYDLYIDTITPTDPTVPPPAVGRSQGIIFSTICRKFKDLKKNFLLFPVKDWAGSLALALRNSASRITATMISI